MLQLSTARLRLLEKTQQLLTLPVSPPLLHSRIHAPPQTPHHQHPPTDVSGEKDTDAAAAEYRQAQAAATSDDRLEIEVDFHWVGEPNISFFVELALAG